VWHVTFVWALFLARPALAQEITLDTLSLHDLPGVMVVVESPAMAERHGLYGDSIRQTTELMLEDAGIRVFTEDEWQVTIGNPLLLVSVNLIHPSDFIYLYNVEVELQQLVVLARDSTIPAFSATWSAPDITGSLRSENLPSLSNHVIRQVDQFISARAAASRMRRQWLRRRGRGGRSRERGRVQLEERQRIDRDASVPSNPVEMWARHAASCSHAADHLTPFYNVAL